MKKSQKIITNHKNQRPSASGKLNLFSAWFLFFATMLILPGCEEETDWQFHPHENGKLVVEAIITDEFKTQNIRLSRTFSELNGTPEPVSGAVVSVSDGQTDFLFSESPSDAGNYLSQQAFAAQLGRVYRMEIYHNGISYFAENEMATILPFDKMTFKPYGESDSLMVDEVAPLYAPDEQAMYEINIDWSHLSAIEPNRAKLFFYTFSTVDVNELFRPTAETVVFPRGSIVVEKKHSLNDDFAAFYRALAMETDWQGGVYDENSASLPTNVSGGAVGFFGVSAVLADTLIAE